MLKTNEFWTVTIVALAAALLAIVNAVLFERNKSLQIEVAERTQFVQQSMQLEVLYREIVKGLADLSVRNQDPALAGVLASQGITVSATPAQPQAPAAPASDARKGAR
jgi:hypothetical protein